MGAIRYRLNRQTPEGEGTVSPGTLSEVELMALGRKLFTGPLIPEAGPRGSIPRIPGHWRW
jgi:hypothetical protein